MTARETILGVDTPAGKRAKKYKDIFKIFIESEFYKNANIKNDENIKENIKEVILYFLSSRIGQNCSISNLNDFCDYVCLRIEEIQNK